MAQALGSKVTSLSTPGAAAPAQRMENRKPQRRKTEYGTQLAEKQLAKKTYGLRERQFSNYYHKAIRQQGDTGMLMQQLLETRLDNVIYRLGFAITRPQARQMVNHGMFQVNGKKVNIPSYQVKLKDEITLKASKADGKLFSDLNERLQKFQPASWLHLDLAKRTGKVLAKPEGAELENIFNPRLIVEFYSK